jgi:hypothetical protein
VPRARLAEPTDDWFFLIRFSGPHMAAVLALVAEHTAIPADELRAACEVREASYVATDVRLRLEGCDAGLGSVSDLVELIDSCSVPAQSAPNARSRTRRHDSSCALQSVLTRAPSSRRSRASAFLG